MSAAPHLDHPIDLRRIYQEAGCSDQCQLTAEWEEDLDCFVIRHSQRIRDGQTGIYWLHLQPSLHIEAAMEYLIDEIHLLHHEAKEREAALDPS